ncbi:MAG TPA: hypothetical protein PLO51_00535 [Candidatus Micrarchaeota archaeon]|nr:hypothetical protein [Candidatus Micrarchaeota archaeon]
MSDAAISVILGSLGVGLLLLSFLLNVFGKIGREHPLYLFGNFIGALLSCYASYLIGYLPFVVLEGAWAIVSLWLICKEAMKSSKSSPKAK